MDLMELDKLSEVQLLVQKSVTTDLKKVALIDEIINLKREREREERDREEREREREKDRSFQLELAKIQTSKANSGKFPAK